MFKIKVTDLNEVCILCYIHMFCIMSDFWEICKYFEYVSECYKLFVNCKHTVVLKELYLF